MLILILINNSRQSSAYTPSKNPVDVLELDSVWKSNHFSSVLGGGDISVDLYRSKTFDISVITGVGYEKMDLLKYDTPGDEEDDTTTVSLNSFNFNAGITCRVHLNYKTSFVLESRYHVLNFNNTGGTDLRGNALVFSCGFTFKSLKRGLNL